MLVFSHHQPLLVHLQWLCPRHTTATVTVAKQTPPQTPTPHYWATPTRGRWLVNSPFGVILARVTHKPFPFHLFFQGERRVRRGDCAAFTFQAVSSWGRGGAAAGGESSCCSLQGEWSPKASKWNRRYISPAGTRSVSILFGFLLCFFIFVYY